MTGKRKTRGDEFSPVLSKARWVMVWICVLAVVIYVFVIMTPKYEPYSEQTLSNLPVNYLLYPGSKMIEDNASPYREFYGNAESVTAFIELPPQTTYTDYTNWLWPHLATGWTVDKVVADAGAGKSPYFPIQYDYYNSHTRNRVVPFAIVQVTGEEQKVPGVLEGFKQTDNGEGIVFHDSIGGLVVRVQFRVMDTRKVIQTTQDLFIH